MNCYLKLVFVISAVLFQQCSDKASAASIIGPVPVRILRNQKDELITSSNSNVIRIRKPFTFSGSGFTSRDSGEYIEQQLNRLLAQSPDKAKHLRKLLKQSYNQRLTELGIRKEKIPKFIPMPVEPETERNPEVNFNLDLNLDAESELESNFYTDLAKENTHVPESDDSYKSVYPAATVTVNSEADLLAAMHDNMSNEIQKFFGILSTFDFGNCFKKKVCDIHTMIHENAKNLETYEQNVISLFEVMKTMYSPENPPDAISANYLKAAILGERHLSTEICEVEYPDCYYYN